MEDKWRNLKDQQKKMSEASSSDRSSQQSDDTGGYIMLFVIVPLLIILVILVVRRYRQSENLQSLKRKINDFIQSKRSEVKFNKASGFDAEELNSGRVGVGDDSLMMCGVTESSSTSLPTTNVFEATRLKYQSKDSNDNEMTLELDEDECGNVEQDLQKVFEKKTSTSTGKNSKGRVKSSISKARKRLADQVKIAEQDQANTVTMNDKESINRDRNQDHSTVKNGMKAANLESENTAFKEQDGDADIGISIE